jgi:hypothetical protein
MKKLLEVKKQIGVLAKNAKNPFYKSQYLDLHDLLTAVEPLLHEQGLILLQPIKDNKVYSCIYDTENSIMLIDSSIDLPDISDPQKLGSAITYFRRYTLKSLLSISEVDDDGNLASKITAPPKKTEQAKVEVQQPKKQPIKPETFAQGLTKAAGNPKTLKLLIDKFDLTIEQTNQIFRECLIEAGSDVEKLKAIGDHLPLTEDQAAQVVDIINYKP